MTSRKRFFRTFLQFVYTPSNLYTQLNAYNAPFLIRIVCRFKALQMVEQL
jgi:hypothetical protein